MDKERIEAIALEVANAMQQGFLWHEGCGWESGIIPSEVREFAHRFLTRIDAERGKEATAWFTDDHLCDRSATTYCPDVAERWRQKGWPVTPLYTTPQPAVPEGYALVPVEQQKNASRYEWLRNSSVGPSQIWELLSDDCCPPIMTLKCMGDLDSAIDAAMLAAAKEPK